ncbi:LacI family DNA-binding transcriptional regulator [Bacillus sonorensis]|uniref:HTH-type transcriptional repressor n=2 Tax=Bacillus sonorensis TaxID=119858 RepID=M5PBN7_9BACI|nr:MULTISPECIES: LacI family DNA-binding transcriptional regulator [Bacillus]TWK79408.1 putative HTH-type transcriptional repressor ExuR [Bacillus paralicheniformis]ASB90745.1 Catabolite control protein A [Bacillus sonorensis]EME73140.1 HTH-type transcriptional repressor [Bacillus sonorensis L12]MBG9914143.1 LacI family transcriptional regulator [Bacillus sonorensis]MCF7616619.1 LacI family transcriptional regulator [Bacillus sonorensis]
MSVTIKDIARLANVSHTTVSRALNNSPLIKEKTKKKILDIAAEMNYKPNFNAKSLVTQKTFTIGLFLTSLTDGTSSSFFADVLRGVNNVIDEHYNMFVRGIDAYHDLSSIHRNRYDGIILISQSERDQAFIDHVTDQNIPIVVLNRKIEGQPVINILANENEGAYLAACHFIENGHKRIAMVQGKEGFKSSQERLEGFLHALRTHDLPIQNEYLVRGDYTMKSGYSAVETLLTLENPPTALFCANDDMAIGAMNALYANGKRCPDDMSIIGFDDIGFSAFTTPSLTTVKKPTEKISMLGAESLLSLIEHPETKGRQSLISTELIIRNSVRRL